MSLSTYRLSGGAKSYGFSLGAFQRTSEKTDPRLHRADPLSPTGGHCGRLVEQEWSELDGFASASRDGDKLEFANESCDEPRYIRRDEPRTRAAVAVSRPREGGTHFRKPLTQSCLVEPPCGRSARIRRVTRSSMCRTGCLSLATALERIGCFL